MRQDVIVTEGIEGWLNFHLSKVDNNRESLCGAHTMKSRMPLRLWGTVGEAHEKYCNKCATIAKLELIPKGLDDEGCKE